MEIWKMQKQSDKIIGFFTKWLETETDHVDRTMFYKQYFAFRKAIQAMLVRGL